MITGTPLLMLLFAIIVFVIILCGYFKMHPFIALISSSILFGLLAGLPLLETIEAIESGFGGLMKYIGLVVVFGSIIGVFLEKSGGALRIAHTIIQLFGKKKSISAMSMIGAVISIPVFCDSGFILLSGLTDRLAQISKQNKTSLTLALATGLYTTHTLVPPTPGPIAAAGNLGASDHLGTLILLGICVTIPVLILTQFLSKWFAKRQLLNHEENHLSVEQSQAVDVSNTPSIFYALTPLLLPVILIGVGTFFKFLGNGNDVIQFLGNPMVALFIGAIFAILLLRPKQNNQWAEYIAEALKIAGPILIITGAGGAFGGVLKAVPLSETVGQWLQADTSSEVVVLLLVFAIAAILKTAQGSSTSAMVITSSILAPLIPSLGWTTPMDYSIAIIAIGAGAMTISHYNDSYFWVVSQFGGMSHDKAYRSFSMMTGLMGIFILLICIILGFIF